MKTLLITNPIEKSKNHICQELQNSWNSICSDDKRKNNKTFLHESEYFKIIDCKDIFESFDKKFIPEIIFIVPELMWSNDDVNEGYDIARELVLNTFKSEFIQIVFLSVVDRVTLKELSDVRNKSFVEAFPHVCLLDNTLHLKFEYYSEIHYKLIKHLAISDHGRLQKISHEMSSVKANIKEKSKSVEINRDDLLEKLEELTLFQQWTQTNIDSEIQKIKGTIDNEFLSASTKTIDEIIDEINLKLPKNGETRNILVKHKSNYKVFIVEDDKKYRTDFYNILSNFYLDVFPDEKDKYLDPKNLKDFSIAEVEKIIKDIGNNYQIFFLDLLYKVGNDQHKFWLDFNGFDLYHLVRKINPYAVIRIITSLPRGIIAKLVEVILNDVEKPNVDQIFTKKYGFEFLKDSIIESIEKINQECKAKEKTKSMWAPFPKEGIFKWEGIRDAILLLMKSENGEFKSIVEKAEKLFRIYEKGDLSLTQQGWDHGELPNTRKEGDYVNKKMVKLINILAHRLIVLYETLKTDECKLYYSEFKVILEKICNLSPSNNYFYTKLGFNLSRNDKEADKHTHWFKINLVNLFPHEYDFVIDIQRKNNKANEDKTLRDYYPNLNEFYLNLLTDTSIYDVWDDLKIDFNPYTMEIISKIENGEDIEVNEFPVDIKLKNVRDFFQSLIKNYAYEFIPQIVDKVTDIILYQHDSFESEFEDTLTNNLINSLINKELDSNVNE